MIVWEKHKRETALNGGGPTFSNDERWSKTKRDIERIDGKLDKTRDSDKRRGLLHQKYLLENELRRLEWAIKESNLNGMYNAGTGSLRKLDPKGMPLRSQNQNGTLDKDSEEIDPGERYTPDGALRERKRLERRAEERKNLQRIIDNAEAILRAEPADSIPAALKPVANDFKAHYNVLKKRRNNQDSLADYWVAWAVISSIMNRIEVDPQIAKYASEQFRPRISKFIKLAVSLHLPPKPLLRSDAVETSGGELEREKIALEGTLDLDQGVDRKKVDTARDDEKGVENEGRGLEARDHGD